jgi:predicted  nucleic acid-binding Zn-ribbon protein
MKSTAEIAYEARQLQEWNEHIRRKEELIQQAADPWAMVRREIDALQQEIDGLRQENNELRHRLEQVERRVAMQATRIGGES